MIATSAVDRTNLGRRRLGQLAKSDRLDARALARYAANPELKLRDLPDAETRNLRELCARRDELVEMLVAEQNRLEHASAAVKGEINGHIDFLRKRIKHADHDIDQAVKRSAVWREKSELLRSVPGVGKVLCASLRDPQPNPRACGPCGQRAATDPALTNDTVALP